MYKELYDHLVNKYPQEEVKKNKSGILDATSLLDSFLVNKREKATFDLKNDSLIFYNPPSNIFSKLLLGSERELLAQKLDSKHAKGGLILSGGFIPNHLRNLENEGSRRTFVDKFLLTRNAKRGIYLKTGNSVSLLYSEKEELDRVSTKTVKKRYLSKYTRLSTSFKDIYSFCFLGKLKAPIIASLAWRHYSGTMNQFFVNKIELEDLEDLIKINDNLIGTYALKEDCGIMKKGEEFFFDGESLTNQRICISYSSRVMKFFEKK